MRGLPNFSGLRLSPRGRGAGGEGVRSVEEARRKRKK